MSRISIGDKHEGFELENLLRTRLLVQANSGGGKSWLLRLLMEKAFGKVQIIAIDPEGEFSTLREKYGYVLVGKEGETPADLRSAELLATRLLEINASAVCDLYEMKPLQRPEWVRLFITGLMNAPKALWHPVIIIVDEAHKFCPERGKGEAVSTEAMLSLATAGRKRGYCSVFATQRLGKLNKDAAAELLNVLIGRTFLDVDRDRAADILGIERRNREQFDETLRSLKAGDFYALGPAIATRPTMFHVAAVTTTHPEAGMGMKATGATPAPEQVKAMLPKLADLPKAAEDKARTEAELRTEIRSLKAQLAVKPKAEIDENQIRRAVESAVAQRDREYRQQLQQHQDVIGKMQSAFAAIGKQAGLFVSIELPKEKHEPVEISLPLRRVVQPKAVKVNPVESTGKLRAGAERMLGALVQWHPNGMREGQMRAHAGMKKSGTFSTYMSDLRTGGYIEERGGELFATDAGIEYFGGNVPGMPSTTEDVMAVWEPKLREGARRILRVLVERGGEPVSMEDLAEASGMTKSGTFSTYLSDLRTARLIVTQRGTAAANRETLFL